MEPRSPRPHSVEALPGKPICRTRAYAHDSLAGPEASPTVSRLISATRAHALCASAMRIDHAHAPPSLADTPPST